MPPFPGETRWRGSLRIIRHQTGGDLLARAEAWLLSSEAENNLVLGVAAQFRGAATTDQGACYWATVETDGSVVGCAFRTPPHQLSLTTMPDEAIGPLAGDVRGLYDALPGVAGPRREATQFAREWAALTGNGCRVRLEMMIRKLTTVNPPNQPPAGELRRSATTDLDLITEWMTGFVRETGMEWQSREVAGRFHAAGKLFVWDHEGARCMAAAARETPRGACINAVYTPPAYRRRGYATAAVATLSQRLLAQGRQFCCLYTDAANPGTNAIYRRIGFRRVREDVHLEFLPTMVGTE